MRPDGISNGCDTNGLNTDTTFEYVNIARLKRVSIRSIVFNYNFKNIENEASAFSIYLSTLYCDHIQ